MMNYEAKLWELLEFLTELYDDEEEATRAAAQAELRQAEKYERLCEAETNDRIGPCEMAGLYEDYDDLCREVHRHQHNSDRLSEAIRCFDSGIRWLMEVEG